MPERLTKTHLEVMKHGNMNTYIRKLSVFFNRGEALKALSCLHLARCMYCLSLDDLEIRWGIDRKRFYRQHYIIQIQN